MIRQSKQFRARPVPSTTYQKHPISPQHEETALQRALDKKNKIDHESREKQRKLRADKCYVFHALPVPQTTFRSPSDPRTSKAKTQALAPCPVEEAKPTQPRSDRADQAPSPVPVENIQEQIELSCVQPEEEAPISVGAETDNTVANRDEDAAVRLEEETTDDEAPAKVGSLQVEEEVSNSPKCGDNNVGFQVEEEVSNSPKLADIVAAVEDNEEASSSVEVGNKSNKMAAELHAWIGSSKSIFTDKKLTEAVSAWAEKKQEEQRVGQSSSTKESFVDARSQDEGNINPPAVENECTVDQGSSFVVTPKMSGPTRKDPGKDAEPVTAGEKQSDVNEATNLMAEEKGSGHPKTPPFAGSLEHSRTQPSLVKIAASTLPTTSHKDGIAVHVTPSPKTCARPSALHAVGGCKTRHTSIPAPKPSLKKMVSPEIRKKPVDESARGMNGPFKARPVPKSLYNHRAIVSSRSPLKRKKTSPSSSTLLRNPISSEPTTPKPFKARLLPASTYSPQRISPHKKKGS